MVVTERIVDGLTRNDSCTESVRWAACMQKGWWASWIPIPPPRQRQDQGNSEFKTCSQSFSAACRLNIEQINWWALIGYQVHVLAAVVKISTTAFSAGVLVPTFSAKRADCTQQADWPFSLSHNEERDKTDIQSNVQKCGNSWLFTTRCLKEISTILCFQL